MQPQRPTYSWPVAAALLLVAALALAGCGQGPADVTEPPSDPAQPAEGPAWITGVVTNVATAQPVIRNCVSESPGDPADAVSSHDPPVCDPDPVFFGSFIVKGSIKGQPGNTSAAVKVGKAVPLTDRDGSAVAWEDLTKGSRVSVWISGEVMESYPVQARATRVVLIKKARTQQAAAMDEPPLAELHFDSGTVKIASFTSCWSSGSASMCADGVPSRGEPELDVPRGAVARLKFSQGTPRSRSVWASKNKPFANSRRLKIAAGETVRFDLAPGIWYVSISTRWAQGDASYSAPIRITP